MSHEDIWRQLSGQESLEVGTGQLEDQLGGWHCCRTVAQGKAGEARGSGLEMCPNVRTLPGTASLDQGATASQS